MPDARKNHDTFKDFILTESVPLSTSYWGNYPKFAVSYFKAQWGDAATKENDYGYDYHPKITGDHSHLPMFVDMMNGKIKGFFVMGQNPAVGGQNARFQRKALAKLDWMVVRDLLRDRDLCLLEKLARGHGRRGKALGHQDRGLLPSCCHGLRDGRLVHEHPATTAAA